MNCLSRDQKIDIAICYLEKNSCEKALKTASAPIDQTAWELYALSGAAGIVVGLIAAQQLRR